MNGLLFQPKMKDCLLTTKDAARYIAMSAAFLERDRCMGAKFPFMGAKIPFIKIGSRSIRYTRADLDAYIEAGRRRSTSDAGTERRP